MKKQLVDGLGFDTSKKQYYTVFYGWNQTDNSSSGILKRYTSRPTSFSEHNGIYRMNIQSIVGK